MLLLKSASCQINTLDEPTVIIIITINSSTWQNRFQTQITFIIFLKYQSHLNLLYALYEIPHANLISNAAKLLKARCFLDPSDNAAEISHCRLQLPSGRAAYLRPNQTTIWRELSFRALIALRISHAAASAEVASCAHLFAGPCHTNLQPCRLRLPMINRLAEWIKVSTFYQLTPAGPTGVALITRGHSRAIRSRGTPSAAASSFLICRCTRAERTTFYFNRRWTGRSVGPTSSQITKYISGLLALGDYYSHYYHYCGGDFFFMIAPSDDYASILTMRSLTPNIFHPLPKMEDATPAVFIC